MSLGYVERRNRLIAYLEAKVQERDWHAVSDAANDLRVLEARVSAGEEPRPTASCPRSADGQHHSAPDALGVCRHCGAELVAPHVYQAVFEGARCEARSIFGGPDRPHEAEPANPGHCNWCGRRMIRRVPPTAGV